MKYFVLDTETTGTRPETDRVVEVCAGLRGPTGFERTFLRRINPGVPIDPGATKVHGIRDEDVAGCPTFGQVAAELREFLASEDVPVYVHNVPFDKTIVEAEYKRAGHEAPSCTWMCTLDMARTIWPGHDNTLSGVAERLGVKIDGNAHAADVDVDTLARCLPQLLHRYAHKMARKAGELAKAAEKGPVVVGGTGELLATAEAVVKKYNERVPNAQVWAAEYVCASDDDERDGQEAIARCKKIESEADKERKELVGGIDGIKRGIDGLFRDGVSGPLTAVRTQLEGKIKPYVAEKIRKQRDAEEAARAALRDAEDRQRKLSEQAAEGTVTAAAALAEQEAVNVQAEAAVEVLAAGQGPAVPVRTTTATAGYSVVYVASIVAPASVPREYWSPSLEAVQRAVDAGARSIPGVEIREDVVVKNRRRS